MSELKINEIKTMFASADISHLKNLIEHFEPDERAGVQTAIAKAKRQLNAYEAETARIEKMKEFEYKYADYRFICGIDEVGRGPLAGPVVAGAVILPKSCDILYLNDSKKLSAKKREELFSIINEKAVASEIGIVSPERIDEINILQATYEAMRMAISRLCVEPSLLLNDAVNIPNVNIKQISIVKGDAKSISIAAASIIAKVSRDRMMSEYAEIYPEYGFESNKGYGSAEHIAAIRKYGPCPIHRKTFIKNFI